MRPIKFKAKHLVSGKWIEGCYVNSYYDSRDEKYYRHAIIASYDIYTYEIDPATLCQFTGLTDCNGKDIWEGDVVSDGANKGIVFFNMDVAQYQVDFSPHDDCPQEMMSNPNWAKVIGNRFDNPELLKEVRS